MQPRLLLIGLIFVASRLFAAGAGAERASAGGVAILGDPGGVAADRR